MAVLDATPATLDVVAYAGDGLAFKLEFRDAVTGDPVDVTGTWSAQVRATAAAVEVLATFDVDDSAATVGDLWLSLPGTTTADLADTVGAVWDVQTALETGPRTWYAGTFTVRGDKTRP